MTSRQNGSTRLHIDISDAVNVMVDDGKALWHIFSSEHLEILKEFIISELRDENQQSFSRIDSIGSYHVYLTDEHLETLKARYNVQPFTFEQRHRDAVFIPAGCAHQVRAASQFPSHPIILISPRSLILHHVPKLPWTSWLLRVFNDASKLIETFAPVARQTRIHSSYHYFSSTAGWHYQPSRRS